MEKIVSPCISICKTDPSTGYCYGCARTSEEKAIWKDENTTNEWKINNISELKNRLSGWQLSSFEESYDFKIKNGISLAKHKMMNKWKKLKAHVFARKLALRLKMNVDTQFFAIARCASLQMLNLVLIKK